MPITTFLNAEEKLRFNATSDEDINELFLDVKKTNQNWFIQEKIFVNKRLFRKPVISKKYTFYYDYAPDMQWDIQIINFNTHGTCVPKEVAWAFLLGMLSKKS